MKLREVKKTQKLRSHSYLVVKPLLCLLSLLHGELSAKPSECGGSLPEFGTRAVFSPFMFFPHLGMTLHQNNKNNIKTFNVPPKATSFLWTIRWAAFWTSSWAALCDSFQRFITKSKCFPLDLNVYFLLTPGF